MDLQERYPPTSSVDFNQIHPLTIMDTMALIFDRLPQPDIWSCRLVCKEWRSMVLKYHLTVSRQPPALKQLQENCVIELSKTTDEIDILIQRLAILQNRQNALVESRDQIQRVIEYGPLDGYLHVISNIRVGTMYWEHTVSVNHILAEIRARGENGYGLHFICVRAKQSQRVVENIHRKLREAGYLRLVTPKELYRRKIKRLYALKEQIPRLSSSISLQPIKIYTSYEKKRSKGYLREAEKRGRALVAKSSEARPSLKENHK